MLSRRTIEQVIDSQKERLELRSPALDREISSMLQSSSHALIITGIRRCGKSTLLQQINRSVGGNTLYLNFEDPRLSGFDNNDFTALNDTIVARQIQTLFFDELQNIDKWENYVRFWLDEGYRIFITGSNASMLSRELGTKLTGRHLTKELFPFSWQEYLDFTAKETGADSAESYMSVGGFPEMLKTGQEEILMQAFNDIVIRDIAVRYNLKHVSTLQQLAVWLISNPGKLVTGNSLRKIFSIGSSASIMEYLSYFSNAWLFFFVPRFSYSAKVQLVNPRKVYSIDNGLAEVNSVSFSADSGRMLENMVFLELRRRNREIYYFAEKNECDFVVYSKGKISGLYQACLQLNSANLDRELAGLTEAMDFFKISKAEIITLNQADSFTIGKKVIEAVPFHKWAGT